MNLIKEKRNEKEMTQEELAVKVGCSLKTIQAIEQFRRKPSLSLTIKLFKALKISLTKIEFFLESYTTKCS